MNLEKMVIVVARYNENLDWLKTIPWKYIVFNKGGDLPEWIKNEVKLPNIGREAHTYLTYIIDYYDNLTDYTIFLQGHPFSHSKKLMEKLNAFEGGRDFFILSDKHNCSDEHGNPSHPGLKVGESAQKIFIDNIKSFEFWHGAEFIVSKKAILFHTKTTYQKILDFVMEEKLSSRARLAGRAKKYSEQTRLFSAWTLERLWKTLFDNEHRSIYD